MVYKTVEHPPNTADGSVLIWVMQKTWKMALEPYQPRAQMGKWSNISSDTFHLLNFLFGLNCRVR